jgi:hypothetical protein
VNLLNFTSAYFTGLGTRLKCIEDDEIRKGQCVAAQVRNRIHIESVIISSVPSIFDLLKSKSYQLSYHGSRDDLTSTALHQRVDRRSHTLTIVETTKGFIWKQNSTV